MKNIVFKIITLLLITHCALLAQVKIGSGGDIESAGTHPAMISNNVKGADKSVADLTARDAIATALRTEGMSCYVVSTQKVYELIGGVANGNWVERATGGGALTGNSIDSTHLKPQSVTASDLSQHAIDSIKSLIPINTQTIIQETAINSATLGVSPPSTSFEPNFMVYASGIPRPNAFSHGQPITWSLLDQADGHGSSFFKPFTTDVSERLVVNYPLVRRVIGFHVTTDESFAANGVGCGASVGTSQSFIQAWRPMVGTQTLVGNGTGWTSTGTLTLGVSTPSSGKTYFQITDGGVVLAANAVATITYNGQKSYSVSRVVSGIPGPYTDGFELRDSAGAVITTAPTSSDRVIISGILKMSQVPLATFSNGTNAFITTSHNFWISGSFEVYLKAFASSTTTIVVLFQPNYPSATSYKVYRSADAAFTSPTLIYTGTAGKYIDGGLTAGTVYFYKLVPIVSGSDTDVGITYNAKTFTN